MSGTAQIIDANGVSYVTTANPMPVVSVPPSGNQPAYWDSETSISITTPLPIKSS
jgi:hypothetical protein